MYNIINKGSENTMKLSDLIIQFRKENNISARKFAALSDLSNAYISLIENESTKSPTLDALKKIAKAMNLDVNELIQMLDDETLINVKPLPKLTDEYIYSQSDISYIKVPLYGDISCGAGAFVDDNILDYVAVPDDGLNSSKEYFAQVAKGDSMIEVGIDDGDIIIFEKTNVIDDGKIGCFCIDENVATCKKLKKGSTFIQLIPANRKYDPIVIDIEKQNFRIVGLLKKSIKNFE